MNLGIVTPQVSNYGGSEIYLLECLKRWQHEAEITLYTCSFSRRLFNEFGISRNVRIVKLPATIGRQKHYGVLEESLILPHMWEARLHQHDIYFLYLFPTQMIRRRPSVWFAAEPLRMLYDLRHTAYSGGKNIEVHFYPKLNYDVVNPAQLDILLQLIEKIDSAPDCDRWATNSNFMAGYLENVYSKRPDLVVYPGVTSPAQVDPPPAVKQAISIGRLWKHKRVDLILRALSMLPEGNLVVVGEGPERPLLERLRRDLRLTGRVRFVGDVSKDRLQSLLAESMCCVYTPIMEPFGMVPLEAAAAGRPVVGTVGGGYSEILNDSLAKLVPASPENVAQAMHDLFSNPDLARQMGAAARKAVAPYSWDRTANLLLREFQDTRKRKARTLKRARTPEIGAHYYTWYRTAPQVEHWNENAEFASVGDFPKGGPYNSSDPALIRKHLRMAEDAGLDFFIVNLQISSQGLNPTEIEGAQALFQTIEKERSNLKVSILLSVSVEDPKLVRTALEQVRKQFMPSPVYQRTGGKPLIWYYLSGPFMGYFFFRYKDLVRLNRGLHPIAAGALIYNKFLPKLLRDFFSGWCLYSPLEVGPSDLREALCAKGYRDFQEDNGKIRVFTVCPGYDDSQIQSFDRMHSAHRKVSRRGLKTYQEMQTYAARLQPLPDMVVITSFNEFHENTHIETSQLHGDVYLKSTKAFSERLKRMK